MCKSSASHGGCGFAGFVEGEEGVATEGMEVEVDDSESDTGFSFVFAAVFTAAAFESEARGTEFSDSDGGCEAAMGSAIDCSESAADSA